MGTYLITATFSRHFSTPSQTHANKATTKDPMETRRMSFNVTSKDEAFGHAKGEYEGRFDSLGVCQ